jgi:hypothetical protein
VFTKPINSRVDYQDLAEQTTWVRWKLLGFRVLGLAFFRMRMSGEDSESEEVLIVTGQCGGEGLGIAGLNAYL